MTESSTAEEIARELTAEIQPLPPGTRIPTHRSLVHRFGASASTVSRALAILAQQGLVSSRPGAGTFRAEAPAPAATADTTWQEAALALNAGPAQGATGTRSFVSPGLLNTLSVPGPELVDLNGGYPHRTLLPMKALGAALARAAKRPQAWDRAPVGGLPDLRSWFARDIGGDLGAEDVLVVGAGQAALSTTLRAVAQPGDPVVLETPTYTGAIAAARAAGLNPVGVPLDEQGMRPEHLDQALERTGARVAVVQPLFQNPTGASMGASRARELLAVARSHEAFLVEDDYARHMVHDDALPLPQPLVAQDRHGTVVHIRSVTKVSSPNLRVAALAARGPVLHRLKMAHVIDTMVVSAPLQHTALEVLTAASWPRHLRELQAALGERRRAAVTAVVQTLGPDVLPHTPRGGYHLWLRLPQGTEESEFLAAATARGVALAPGTHFRPGPVDEACVRLSYAAAPTTADVLTGIRRLEGLV